MPRLARLDAPGVLHHVIIRGIERRVIFRDDFDRENFLERLSILVPETTNLSPQKNNQNRIGLSCTYELNPPLMNKVALSY